MSKTETPIPVKVIIASTVAALVEWVSAGATYRATVPASALADGKCSPSELAAGIPYGLPWAQMLTPLVGERMARLIETALHNSGLWLGEEVQRSPQAAAGALQAAYGADLAVLLAIARGQRPVKNTQRKERDNG